MTKDDLYRLIGDDIKKYRPEFYTFKDLIFRQKLREVMVDEDKKVGLNDHLSKYLILRTSHLFSKHKFTFVEISSLDHITIDALRDNGFSVYNR